MRVLRSDYRQDGDLAAVWLTTRRLLPVAGSVIDGEWIEHLVLRRIDGRMADPEPRGHGLAAERHAWAALISR